MSRPPRRITGRSSIAGGVSRNIGSPPRIGRAVARLSARPTLQPYYASSAIYIGDYMEWIEVEGEGFTVDGETLSIQPSTRGATLAWTATWRMDPIYSFPFSGMSLTLLTWQWGGAGLGDAPPIVGGDVGQSQPEQGQLRGFPPHVKVWRFDDGTGMPVAMIQTHMRDVILDRRTPPGSPPPELTNWYSEFNPFTLEYGDPLISRLTAAGSTESVMLRAPVRLRALGAQMYVESMGTPSYVYSPGELPHLDRWYWYWPELVLARRSLEIEIDFYEMKIAAATWNQLQNRAPLLFAEAPGGNPSQAAIEQYFKAVSDLSGFPSLGFLVP